MMDFPYKTKGNPSLNSISKIALSLLKIDSSV
jgi:hypothetical protein